MCAAAARRVWRSAEGRGRSQFVGPQQNPKRFPVSLLNVLRLNGFQPRWRREEGLTRLRLTTGSDTATGRTKHTLRNKSLE